MFNKTRIFNLTLNALGLTKRITDADSDDSTEAMNLRDIWDVAVEAFLEEANLAETNEIVTLTLVAEDPNDHWSYAYAYPNNTAMVRRIVSDFRIDNNETRIEFIKGIHDGQEVIFTDRIDAEAEIVKDTNLFIGLSANAGMALSFKLASFAHALIQTSQDPIKQAAYIDKQYEKYKALAQIKESKESQIYQEDINFPTQSAVRMS